MNMSRKRPEPAWLNTTSHLTEEPEHSPGPWQLHIDRWPNGELKGRPYIYAPNGPDGHRHICEPCLDLKASPEIQREQIANARLLAEAPQLIETLRTLAEIGEAGVIERRETGKPTWSALDAVATIARAAIAKTRRQA